MRTARGVCCEAWAFDVVLGVGEIVLLGTGVSKAVGAGGFEILLLGDCDRIMGESEFVGGA